MPFGNRFFYRIFNVSIFNFFKKYYPSENPKFNSLGIFQSLKLRNLMGKILRISHKLHFTPNTLGCYGLKLGTIADPYFPFYQRANDKLN